MSASTPHRTTIQTAEPSPLLLPRGRRLGFALLVVLLVTIFFAASFALLGTIAPRDNLFEPTPAAFLACVLIESAEAILIVWLVLGRIGGLSLPDLGWRITPLRRNLLEGGAGFLAAAVLILVVLAATGVNPVAEVKAWAFEPALADRALWLLIGLGVPFVEESVFRGTLQPVLVRKLGRIGGVLVMALIFSLYHLPRGLTPLAGRFACGAVLGVVRERTGGLFACWLAHMLIWLIIGTR